MQSYSPVQKKDLSASMLMMIKVLISNVATSRIQAGSFTFQEHKGDISFSIVNLLVCLCFLDCIDDCKT